MNRRLSPIHSLFSPLFPSDPLLPPLSRKLSMSNRPYFTRGFLPGVQPSGRSHSFLRLFFLPPISHHDAVPSDTNFPSGIDRHYTPLPVHNFYLLRKKRKKETMIITDTPEEWNRRCFSRATTKTTVIADTTKVIAAYGRGDCIIFVFLLKVIWKEKQI